MHGLAHQLTLLIDAEVAPPDLVVAALGTTREVMMRRFVGEPDVDVMRLDVSTVTETDTVRFMLYMKILLS